MCMRMDQHPYGDRILKRLKRQHLLLWLSTGMVKCGFIWIAWLIFLLPVEYYTPYAGVEWRYARYFFVLATAMIMLGLVGRAFAAKRVDELLPILIEGCCADCGYTLGRPVFDGQCPECGASLIRSKQRDRWVAVYRGRNAGCNVSAEH